MELEKLAASAQKPERRVAGRRMSEVVYSVARACGGCLVKSGDIIQGKLRACALRKGIQLQGSEGERGERNYTLSVQENLFGNALSDDA